MQISQIVNPATGLCSVASTALITYGKDSREFKETKRRYDIVAAKTKPRRWHRRWEQQVQAARAAGVDALNALQLSEIERLLGE